MDDTALKMVLPQLQSDILFRMDCSNKLNKLSQTQALEEMQA